MSTAEPGAEPVSFGRIISDLATRRPRDVALIFAPERGPEVSLTWRDLETRALQMADLLGERGLGQDSLLVVALRNSPEHVLCALAAWKLGACVLPLRWDLPEWERGRLLELAKPTLLVSPGWESGPAPVISLEELRATATRPPRPLPDRVAEPARMLASSGSTGTPKLIVKPNRGEVVPGVPPSRPIEFQPGTATELVPAPLYHTNGFMLLHSVLLGGDRIVLMERFEAARVLELIERHRVNFVTMVPTMLLRVAREPDFERYDLSSIAAVLQGGATCPDWLIRTWIDRVGGEHFHMSYGSTEGAGLARISGTEWLEHPGSVGLPWDSEFRILDEEGAELGPGEVGEIFGRHLLSEGPSFAYLGVPDARRTADGFASVGDLGWLDEEGYLYIADRRVDMVISGGANIFPAEIESVLVEHPGVFDAAVIGLPDPEWGQRVHAIVCPRDPAPDDLEASLRAHCRERLAAYKVPKSFERVSALPRSDAGKLNRSALVEDRTG